MSVSLARGGKEMFVVKNAKGRVYRMGKKNNRKVSRSRKEKRKESEGVRLRLRQRQRDQGEAEKGNGETKTGQAGTGRPWTKKRCAARASGRKNAVKESLGN